MRLEFVAFVFWLLFGFFIKNVDGHCFYFAAAVALLTSPSHIPFIDPNSIRVFEGCLLATS